MSESRRKDTAHLKLRRRLAEADDRCIYCDTPVTAETMHIEHMPPIGMFKDQQRLQGMEFAACKSCNNGTRGADTVAAFVARFSPRPGVIDWRLVEAARLRGSLRPTAPGVVEEFERFQEIVVIPGPGGSMRRMLQTRSGPRARGRGPKQSGSSLTAVPALPFRAYRPGRIPPGLSLHTLRPDTMGDVLQFIPRPKRTAPEALPPLASAELRASLEQAAQTALNAADRIIAVLDRMDGDADHEETGDAEPSLAAPENHERSQVVYMRGNDQDCEEEVPETALPEVAAEPMPETEILPWRGRGNVVAAAGSFLVDLLERA
jgi:hypothetical protein